MYLFLRTKSLGICSFFITLHADCIKLHHTLCQWHKVQDVSKWLNNAENSKIMCNFNTKTSGLNGAQKPLLVNAVHANYLKILLISSFLWTNYFINSPDALCPNCHYHIIIPSSGKFHPVQL